MAAATLVIVIGGLGLGIDLLTHKQPMNNAVLPGREAPGSMVVGLKTDRSPYNDAGYRGEFGASQFAQVVAQGPPQAPWNTDAYDRIYDNRFLESIDHPYSTFSIDVDAASYSNVRRFVERGQLPPADAVRIEEMINYFAYDYPDPEGADPFSITLEVAPCPWNGDNKLVHIGLQGERVALEDMPPNNLVFLLDVSGSIQPPNKLPLLKTAFRLLADNLRPEDRVAVVVYAGGAGVKLAYKVAEERHHRRGQQPRHPGHRR